MARTNEILTRISAIETELSALKSLLQADSQPAGNAARKAVIERARAFVSGHTRFALDNVEFYVNPKKGVVTALKKSRYGTVLRKAFARCAPGDVFNADIGKAIAVGRLYGVDVPAEFLDAPKPDEPAVGAVVMRFNRFGDKLGAMTVERVRLITGKDFDGNNASTHVINGCNGYGEKLGDYIIDDTEAQY